MAAAVRCQTTARGTCGVQIASNAAFLREQFRFQCQFSFHQLFHTLEQWSSAWGTRAPRMRELRGTRKHEDAILFRM
jgi:hypothetical protein